MESGHIRMADAQMRREAVRTKVDTGTSGPEAGSTDERAHSADEAARGGEEINEKSQQLNPREREEGQENSRQTKTGKSVATKEQQMEMTKLEMS